MSNGCAENGMRRCLVAVYPGTFDPITLGHEDVVRRAAQLFDHLVVAVAEGHHKKPLFSLGERMAMAEQAVEKFGNVSVKSYGGLLRDFVMECDARAMVRGLRAVTDFDYEFQLAGINRRLMPDVETVFLTPGDQFQFISSSFVREIALLGGAVNEFVAPHVLQRLQQKVSEDTRGA